MKNYIGRPVWIYRNPGDHDRAVLTKQDARIWKPYSIGAVIVKVDPYKSNYLDGTYYNLWVYCRGRIFELDYVYTAQQLRNSLYTKNL